MRGVKLIGLWGLALFFALRFLGVCSGGNAPNETIEIGYIGALHGGDYSGQGLADELGAPFAVAQARSLRGFSLKFVPLDDTAQGAYSADRGVEDIEQFVSDGRVLGVVGPLRAPVAFAALPVANMARLAVISPSITYPCLTLVRDYCQHDGSQMVARMRPTGTNNFFRIAASETFLGPGMADYAYRTLGLRKVAVFDDGLVMEGLVEADGFTAQFSRLGGSVVARATFDLYGPSVPDFRPWLQQAKAAGAQAVYAGALSENACAARAQSQGVFDASTYFLGPDGAYDFEGGNGIADKVCVDNAGVMANDHLIASSGLGDAAINPGAVATIRRLCQRTS